ncbi:MAG: hypothetical protein DPW14_14700 [Planctomycetes bacterium]|nr:hypothetical protein [Planctomycetota bacterium]
MSQATLDLPVPPKFKARAPSARVGAESPAPSLGLARGWASLAFFSLLVAGLFAFIPVIGRTPGLSQLIEDPTFAKRFLVVHVDLALLVWFGAMELALFQLLPARVAPNPLRRGAVISAWLGTLLMLASLAWPAEPVLSNYVPVLDHPVFLLGLGLFGVGMLGGFVTGPLTLSHEEPRSSLLLPAGAMPGLRACALAFIMAVITMAASAQSLPSTYTRDPLYPLHFFESTFWGGGHILQVANVAAMMSAWLLLLAPLLRRNPISRKTATLLFAGLILPHLAGPLVALQGAQTGSYFSAFTELMRWGIFPAVLLMLGILIAKLVRASRRGELATGWWRSPAFAGFAASAGLTITGFLCGALISGSNVLIPAHYHASIGGVTVAFMAAAFPLMEHLKLGSLGPRASRLSAWQPWLFGVGQVTFVVGLALAGLHGMARKVYGAEQQVSTAQQTTGLAIMALGGLLAVAGGGLFVALVIAAWRRRPRQAQDETNRSIVEA